MLDMTQNALRNISWKTLIKIGRKWKKIREQRFKNIEEHLNDDAGTSEIKLRYIWEKLEGKFAGGKIDDFPNQTEPSDLKYRNI